MLGPVTQASEGKVSFVVGGEAEAMGLGDADLPAAMKALAARLGKSLT